MFRFQYPPDSIFLDILHDAIEDTLLWLERTDYDQEDFSNSYPESAKCFHPKLAHKTLKLLLRASQAKSLYQLTDFHWLLLYEVLWKFCVLFNEEPEEIAPALEEKYGFCEIGFYEIIDLFFWDTDFLLSPDDLVDIGKFNRDQLGLSKETFGVVQRMVPHPEELKIIRLSKQEGKEWKEVGIDERPELFQPGSQKYPF